LGVISNDSHISSDEVRTDGKFHSREFSKRFVAWNCNDNLGIHNESTATRRVFHRSNEAVQKVYRYHNELVCFQELIMNRFAVPEAIAIAFKIFELANQGNFVQLSTELVHEEIDKLPVENSLFKHSREIGASMIQVDP
jgi:hypothetical protein